MPQSKVNTGCSTHRVLHALSTAFTTYCMIPKSTVSHSQPVSYLSADHVCTHFSTFHELGVNQWIESQLPLLLPPELPPAGSPPPSSPAISLDHGLQVSLQIGSITASSASRHLLSHGLWVYLYGYSSTMWWKRGCRRPTAHHLHSAAPPMASDGNSSERAVLVQAVWEEGERIWRDTRPWWTTQIVWIYECLARVCVEPHKSGGSMKARQECKGPRAGTDRSV